MQEIFGRIGGRVRGRRAAVRHTEVLRLHDSRCLNSNIQAGIDTPQLPRTDSHKSGALLEKNLARRSESERGERSVLPRYRSGSTTTNGVLTDRRERSRWKTIRRELTLWLRPGVFMKSCSQSGGSKEIARIVATGYGRELIDFADETVTEISCRQSR